MGHAEEASLLYQESRKTPQFEAMLTLSVLPVSIMYYPFDFIINLVFSSLPNPHAEALPCGTMAGVGLWEVMRVR